MLRDRGCQKLNFAGGEPFLPQYKAQLGEMIRFAKIDCKFPSVSIITNGVYLDREWLAEFHSYLDILGVSCDSAKDELNKLIGRGDGDHTRHVRRVAALCHEFGIMLKLNTVVNRHNWEEDLSAFVDELRPMRWKIFQVLPLEGENTGTGALRSVAGLTVTDAEFDSYVRRNSRALRVPAMIRAEGNAAMRCSYVLVDEFGRFLDSSLGGKRPTESMLVIGIDAALQQLAASDGGGFDAAAFYQRDGHYGQGPAWSAAPAAPASDGPGLPRA